MAEVNCPRCKAALEDGTVHRPGGGLSCHVTLDVEGVVRPPFGVWSAFHHEVRN